MGSEMRGLVSHWSGDVHSARSSIDTNRMVAPHSAGPAAPL